MEQISTSKDRRVKIEITSPVDLTFALTLIILLIFFTGLELFARTDFVTDNIPAQALGLNHSYFEVQFTKIEEFYARYGRIDCIFIGSSELIYSVDPAVIGKEFNQITGRPLLCYNFGVPGMSPKDASLYARILIDRYHPKIIIYVSSFGEFSEGRDKPGNRKVRNSDWIQFQLGTWNLNGWLIEKSYAYRLMLFVSYGLKNQLDIADTWTEYRKFSKEINESGFYPKYWYGNVTLDDDDKEELLVDLGNFSLPDRHLDALEDLSKLKDIYNLDLLFVESPVTQGLINVFERGAFKGKRDEYKQFISNVYSNISEIAARHDSEYWRSTILDFIPSNGWQDFRHLNLIGAQVFSEWLGKRMGDAYLQHRFAFLEGLQ